MKRNSLIFSILVISLHSFSQEKDDNIVVDLLFLKIQELEIEIADLRNRLESQDFLIQKLIQESVQETENADKDNINLDDFSSNNTIKFSGVDDTKSKEEVYKLAIKALGDQDFVKASSLLSILLKPFQIKKSFHYLIFGLEKLHIFKQTTNHQILIS